MFLYFKFFATTRNIFLTTGKDIVKIGIAISIINSALIGCSNIKSSTRATSTSVEITSFLGDNQVFVEGDPMEFFINLSVRSYLYLFYENAAGEVVQLLPSVIQADNLYQAGDFTVFPPANGNIQLTVAPPFGNEKLVLFACNKSVTLSPSNSLNHLQYFDEQLNILSDNFTKLAISANAICSSDTLHFSTKR